MTHKEFITSFLAANPSLKRHDAPCEILIDFDYLFATNDAGEGYFLVWTAGGTATVTEEIYNEILLESKVAGLKAPHHIIGRYLLYQSPNIKFYQIQTALGIEQAPAQR